MILYCRLDARCRVLAARLESERRAAAAEQVDAVVACNAQDPGGKRLAGIEVADAGIGADERFLSGVARLLTGTQEAAAEAVYGLLVLLDQPREGGLVARRGRARPFRLVGGTRGPDQVGGGRQGKGERECRVHGCFYGFGGDCISEKVHPPLDQEHGQGQRKRQEGAERTQGEEATKLDFTFVSSH